MSYLFKTNKSKYLMINIQGLLISEKKEGCINYCDERVRLSLSIHTEECRKERKNHDGLFQGLDGYLNKSHILLFPWPWCLG